MNTKVKFKAIDYKGKIKHKIISIDHPEFSENTFEFAGNDFTESVESQVLDYLDGIDKKNIMDDNDWSIIVDYWVHVPKKRKTEKENKREVLDALMILNPNEEFINNFDAVYRGMYDSIKKLSVADQIAIVTASMNVGMKSAITAYQNIKEAISIIFEDVDKKYNELKS